jgi:hypothetical protein
LIHGNVDKNFSGDDVQFHPVDDLVLDIFDVTLNVVSSNRVEISAYWLRGGLVTNAKYSDDGGLSVISKRSGGVTSAKLGTMHFEYFDYEYNVKVDEYGYTFARLLKTITRIIDTSIPISECKFNRFEQCV